jgi:hypothetical protein
MRPVALILGGLVAGILILAGEVALNLAVLGDEVALLLQRFALPHPTPMVMAQVVARLLLLGVFAVWLATMLDRTLDNLHMSGIVAGLCIWILAWAWVQWAMVNTGFVTASIAAVAVAWGFVEVPLAAWAGTWVYGKLSARAVLA